MLEQAAPLGAMAADGLAGGLSCWEAKAVEEGPRVEEGGGACTGIVLEWPALAVGQKTV